MGSRLHVATTYQVSYQNSPELYHWQAGPFQNLLMTIGVNFTGELWDNNFEVSAEELEAAIALELEGKDEDFIDDEIMDLINELYDGEGTAKKCAEDLRRYIEVADKSSGWLHFSFF